MKKKKSRMSHREAVEALSDWASSTRSRFLRAKDTPIGTKFRPDVTTVDPRDNVWDIYDVKTNKTDLQRVMFQIDSTVNNLIKKGHKARGTVALTKELYNEMRREGELRPFVQQMADLYFGVVVVYKTKVMTLKKPVILGED